MKDDINFVCPKCGQTFTMSELIDHNGKALMDYINSEVKIELNKQEEELVAEAKAQAAKDFEAKQKEILSNYDKQKDQLVIKYNKEQADLKMDSQETINNLNAKINELNSQYKNLQDSIQSKVDLEKQQLINQYERSISENESTIKELKTQYKALEESLNNKVDLEKQQLVNKYEKTLSENESLIKELKSTLENTKKDLEAQKVTEIQKKEIEFKDKLSEVIETKDKEINELKIQNNLNRVINNKTKGENFEHEVEGELRKSFGFVDDIEKINDTINNQKADFLQTVMNSNKEEIGKIVYEVKNAAWSDAWIPKLIQDCANNKTKYGVLIATSFSDRYHDVPFVKSTESDNIFICDPYSFVFVAQLLRRMVILENDMKVQKELLTNGNDNELLKQYETQINAIKDFMISELPNYQKSFYKQLESLESVKRSLNNNESKLDTTIHMLKSKTEKLIFAKLEDLTKIKLDQQSEGDE